MKRLGIGLSALASIVALVFLAWPSVETDPLPRDRDEVRKKFAKQMKIRPLKPLPKRRVVPKRTAHQIELPKATMKVRRPIRTRGPVDDQVQAILREPLDPPTHIDDDEVAINRGVWRRNERLGELEHNLVGRLKGNPEPHTKLEIQIALAEVYAERVETLALYEAPSVWDDDRALRWHEKVEDQIATAEHKAAMLLRISQQEARNWPDDDPAVQKLQQLQ